VLGYTTEEIEQLIEQQLLDEQFKATANIFVTVKLAGLSYTASGEIGASGTNIIYKDRVNIFEAVANSGGIPITGNIKEVQIIRQYPQGQQIHMLDLTDINVFNSPYYYIQPNDIIYVTPVKQKTWGVGVNGRESLQTIITVLGLITTTILLINR
jgi:polysaccharide export outer membrane protein